MCTTYYYVSREADDIILLYIFAIFASRLHRDLWWWGQGKITNGCREPMKNGIFPHSVRVLNSYSYYSHFLWCAEIKTKQNTTLFASATLFNLIRLKYAF